MGVLPTFWPYAISHAACIHDHSPQHGQQKSQFELFTNETVLLILDPMQQSTLSCLQSAN
jgi:hypothetical protein